MANDYKPLNPNSKVITGRLGSVLWFINKTFSNAAPAFAEDIKVEDQVNAILKCEFPKIGNVSCVSSSLYNSSWSLMRPVGSISDDKVVMMLGMGESSARDPIPQRLFVFRVGDVESKVINTKIGDRDSTFFSMDRKDTWEQFSCDAHEVTKAIRSVVAGSVDPDLQNGPFKSYLTALINGEKMPTVNAASNNASNGDGDGGDQDWDDDIPF